MGFDIHRVVEGRQLVLGGVVVPWAGKGLQGHSDADVIFHAVCDALLGAIGAGDIGNYFPDTDPRWKNTASGIFVTKVLELVEKRGFRVENVDITVLAEEPKLASHQLNIRRSIAKALGVEPARVNVKAKTMEQLGPIGQQEALAAYAVVSVGT